jgi:hypothetical protein
MRNLLVMEDEVRLVPDDWARRCECIHGVDLANSCCLDCREATCDLELPADLAVSGAVLHADLAWVAANVSDGWAN